MRRNLLVLLPQFLEFTHPNNHLRTSSMYETPYKVAWRCSCVLSTPWSESLGSAQVSLLAGAANLRTGWRGGQRDGMAGKGTCRHAWRLEFHTQDTCGGKTEQTSKVVLWALSTHLLHTHTHTRTPQATLEFKFDFLFSLSAKKEISSWNDSVPKILRHS